MTHGKSGVNSVSSHNDNESSESNSMDHHHIFTATDGILCGLAIAINWVTWTGAVEAFDMLQKGLTIIGSLALAIYYCYGIVEKHKAINGTSRKKKQ